jgi:hypothetical protein
MSHRQNADATVLFLCVWRPLGHPFFDLAARQNEVVVVTVTAPGPGRYITNFDELPICYVSRL